MWIVELKRNVRVRRSAHGRVHVGRLHRGRGVPGKLHRRSVRTRANRLLDRQTKDIRDRMVFCRRELLFSAPRCMRVDAVRQWSEQLHLPMCTKRHRFVDTGCLNVAAKFAQGHQSFTPPPGLTSRRGRVWRQTDRQQMSSEFHIVKLPQQLPKQRGMHVDSARRTWRHSRVVLWECDAGDWVP